MRVQTLAQNHGVLISEAPSPWSSPHEDCAGACILAGRVPSPQPPKCPRQFGSRDPVRWEPPRLGPLLQEHCVAPAWGFPTSRGRRAWHGTALRVAELLAPPPERDCQPQSTWGNEAQKRKWPQVPPSASRYNPPPEAGENPGEKQEPAVPSRGRPPRKSAFSRVTDVFGCVESLLRHPRSSSLLVGPFVAAHGL